MAITNRALALASRWFDDATVRRTFEPLVADWQREWQDAAPSRRISVAVRGLAAFICAVIVSSPSLFHSHAPSSVTNRVAVRMTRFIAPASMLLMYPYLVQIQESGWRFVLFIAVVPQAITVVFPFSMIGAVDAIRRYDPLAPHVERALVVKLGVVAVLFMIVFGGFVVPAANQLYRKGVTPGPAPARGVRELTTYQLIADPTLASAQESYTGGADRATRIQQELNNRAALAVAPVFLLWLRWRWLASTRTRRWWWPLPSSLAAILSFVGFMTAFFSGWWLEHRFQLSPGIGYWVPIIAIALWGTLFFERPRSQRRT